MKRFIGWAGSWVLVRMGDGAATVLEWAGERPVTEPLYSVYNALMVGSLRVQEWGGGSGPWRIMA